MKRLLMLGALIVPAAPLQADPAVRDTRMLHAPDVSKRHVAFVYDNDIWVADRDGGSPRRLTSHPGVESSPHFAPDGESIAFTGHYEGNDDVYVVPTAGGPPVRLTWHPGADIVRGWTPDGSAVLFISQRSSSNNRYRQFYTVPADGGFETRLEIPNGFKGSYSPDGNSLAYTPLAEPFRQWKGYRGGTHSRIWIYKFDDHSVEQVPQPEGRCNDTDPMWIGDTLYFLSDRDGEFNLYAFDRDSEEVARLTEHEDFPIDAASAGDGAIIYERAGYLHLFDPETRESERLEIGVASDLVEARPRYVSGKEYLRDGDISPKGKRAVFEFRGEIVTVPADKGDVRNLTETTDAHERSPAWSPDGKSIAYVSDASGEYRLVIAPQDGRGEAKDFPLGGAGYYHGLSWSPDGERIAFLDNSGAFRLIAVESGEVTSVVEKPAAGEGAVGSFGWSPDSRWIAYALENPASFRSIHLYSIADAEATPLTDGLAHAINPTFDAGGKYLYFLGSTDAGPVVNGFELSSADMQMSFSIYLAVLDAETPSPLVKPSDEEGESKSEKDDDEEKKEDEDREEGKAKAEEEDEEKAAPEVVVDLDGIGQRVLTLPIPSGFLAGLVAGDEGQVYYLRREGAGPGQAGLQSSKPALHHYDLEGREDETLAEGIDGYWLSSDRKKLMYQAEGDFGVVDLGKFTPDQGRLNTGAIRVRVEPRSEWPQMFREAWRINRDYFYDPDMHGLDWGAIRAKYEPFLPDLANRDDLNRVIRAMCSELGVGHSYLGGGDAFYKPEDVPVGLLGADYEVSDGRYRFEKVYGGLNWNPDLRAPLTEPGVNVKAGEYLLAVNGRDLRASTNLYSLFEQTAGKLIEIEVGPDPDGEGSRTVLVEPIADEAALRNRDWIESNLRKVHEATDGRVAYVYVPNTTTAGHEAFKRYFFPQADKEAVIVDERFNAGGQLPDYYIDILKRRLFSRWARRYGTDVESSGGSIPGPKVMLIDETAGSGGDLLPWMFREFEVGPLVGKRTWGGLIGIGDYPPLMDGGRVTAPNFRFFTDEGWSVENEGVPPDVEVEQWPSEVIAGRDPPA